ncbi:MAG TPA: hypothetical protein VJY34_03400 [Roseiarcus sp.]|nr:hypothetical protein [Roseiarcus sp.]
MIEQRRQPSLSATEHANSAGEWRPILEESNPSPRAPIESYTRIRVGETTGGGLNKLLALLVAVTLACGAAAGVAVTFAPSSLDGAADGY